MSEWRDMKSMPIGDHRNMVVEVRGPVEAARAYWTGRFWAYAPVSDQPLKIGFAPAEYRPLPPADRFDDVRRELMGGRWTASQADDLIELILQGAAHDAESPALDTVVAEMRRTVGPRDGSRIICNGCDLTHPADDLQWRESHRCTCGHWTNVEPRNIVDPVSADALSLEALFATVILARRNRTEAYAARTAAEAASRTAEDRASEAEKTLADFVEAKLEKLP